MRKERDSFIVVGELVPKNQVTNFSPREREERGRRRDKAQARLQVELLLFPSLSPPLLTEMVVETPSLSGEVS